jgi:hypothetical protein
MESEKVLQVQTIPLPMERTLRSLRRTLQAAEIDVVQQIDLSREFQSQLAAGSNRCVLLLVDCPLLLFEAVALDRAAAVSFPLHIVVTGDDTVTSIHWAHPGATASCRLPATVKRPVDALHARLTQLLGHPKDWQDLRL